MARILVVDDEESIRFSFRKILSRAGYDVIVAAHMIDAKAILPANEFEVAIIDRLLESYDGIDLIKHIKTVQPYCETILVSAYPTFKSASETLKLNAFAYLTKPVKKDELCQAVGEAVLKARSRRESRHREIVFQSLFDALPNAVVVRDLNRNVRFVNHAFTRMFGYAPGELGGKPMPNAAEWDEAVTMPGVGELPWETPVPERETRGRTKEGETMDVAVVHAPCNDENGEADDLLTIIRDISENKQLEARLQHDEKLEAIGTLAGGVAHDFNNILSSIIGFTELALGDSEKESAQRANLDEVLVACRRAKDLVAQILMFSKQSDQDLKPVRLKRIVDGTLKLIRASLPSTIEIRRIVKSDSVVMADPARLNQVIMNLCTNAGRAMGEKGGLLEVELVDVALDSESATACPDIPAGTYARLTVSDDGHGMSPEVMKRIFDPFFSTIERVEGVGLGLSVVHGIVTSFGGFITPTSQEGKGSSLRVHLPAIEVESPPETDKPSTAPLGNERVLFIDDEPPIAKMAGRMLGRLGYAAETRTSGEEALDLFKENPDGFDIVITDLSMPDMPGDELAGELRRIRPDIPIILCTGFGNTEAEEEAEAMEVNAFVTKPILMREIAKTIRRILDNKSE